MKYIFILLLSIASFGVSAQDIRFEFTSPEDSLKLRGIRIYLEIDSVYKVSDSSGVKFVLEMVNQGDAVLKLINPLYDTKLDINPSFWLLPSKERLVLKEVYRWPIPKLANKVRPYRLEKVIISGKKAPKDKYENYWKLDTLFIEPGQVFRYELNLFERVVFDKEVRFKMYTTPLPRGNYYVIFGVSLDLDKYLIKSKSLKFKMRLK